LEIEFDNRKLRDLYEKGTSKKYRLDKRVLEKFFMRVQQLEASVSIYDLRNTPSLNFERIKRTKNLFSIRLDKAYRLEFRIEFKDKKRTKGKIIVKEISKHYGE